MADYSINIVNTGGMLATITVAIRIAKLLTVSNLPVDTGKGFYITVSHDNNSSDIYEIYRLKLENMELKKKKK